MSREAESCFAAQRAYLAASGVPLAARLELCGGILCGYRGGVVRLALPELDSPEGRLRASMLASLMGTTPAEVAWLFRALLPRLSAHEIGHALRDEAGQLGADVRVEEQAAERLAHLLSRDAIASADRARARDLLGAVTARLGGVAEAAALHRHPDRAARALRVSASPESVARARTRLQRDYHRDVTAYLQITAAWCFIDLTLDPEDDLDAFRRDLLAA